LIFFYQVAGNVAAEFKVKPVKLPNEPGIVGEVFPSVECHRIMFDEVEGLADDRSSFGIEIAGDPDVHLGLYRLPEPGDRIGEVAEGGLKGDVPFAQSFDFIQHSGHIRFECGLPRACRVMDICSYHCETAQAAAEKDPCPPVGNPLFQFLSEKPPAGIGRFGKSFWLFPGLEAAAFELGGPCPRAA